MTWMLLLLVAALVVRLTVVAVRYRAIRRDGHEVRWEFPLARWYRQVTGRSKGPKDRDR